LLLYLSVELYVITKRFPLLYHSPKVLSPGLYKLLISYNYLSDNLVIIYVGPDFNDVNFTHPLIEYYLIPGVIDEY